MTAVVIKPALQTRSVPENNLINLAAPVLELVMKIKAGLIAPSNDLRRTVDEHLKRMEQQGDMLGYRGRHLQETKFALAAFVDETVLTADFPLRDEWEKYPLQLEYFGEHLAGVTFFERLNGLLGDAAVYGEAIEVYYLCLLIGFKGKYKIYLEDQLKGVIENVADHLRRIGRLHAGALSPHWKASDQPEPPADPGLPQWLKIGAGAALGFAILLYMILRFWLISDLNAAKEQLLR